MAWERAGFTLLLLLIQSILIGLKLDHVIHSSWWAVFVPVYVWAGIMLLIVAVACYEFCRWSCVSDEYYEVSMPPVGGGNSYPIEEEEKERMGILSYTRALYLGVCAVLALVLVILVAVRAEGESGMPWAVVFIPIYVFLAVLLCVVIYQGMEYTRGSIDRGPLDALPGITSWIQWFWLLNFFVWGLILIILLAVKLGSGLEAWNYWAVLSPLWVLLITAALLFLSSIPFLVLKLLEFHLVEVLFFIFAYIAAVLALIFLILRADKTIHWDWSLVFIPLYVLEALLLLYIIAKWLHEPAHPSYYVHTDSNN